jgi:hypothetical protein
VRPLIPGDDELRLAVDGQARRPTGGAHAVNPLTRIGIETAVLIIGIIVLMVLMAYVLGAFIR